MKPLFTMILLALLITGCAPQTIQERQERALENMEPIGEQDILEKDGEGIYEDSAIEPW